MALKLEFWPEHDGGPLWSRDGATIDLNSLPLSRGLREQLTRWNGQYDDNKLPTGRSRDEAWLRQGERLLRAVRHELVGYEVIVHEDWWGEPGLPFPGSR